MSSDAGGSPADDDLDRADARLLTTVDAALAEGYRRGGDHLACHAGCSECCVGPFSINALDGRRLRQGLAALATTDPERAAAIVRRARAAVELLRPGFPGDAQGILFGVDEAVEDAYLEHHADLPCPVLDPQTGHCQLYDHRPMTCRSYGPPLRLGDVDFDPCRLCFRDAGPETVEACRVDPDPEGLEDAIVDAVERAAGGGGGDRRETLIAFALTDRP